MSEVFKIKNGYTPSKANPKFWEGEDCTLPWFRMEDIRENGRILSDSIQHITPKAVKGKLFPANSIIVATTATIGEHALTIVDSLANQQFTFLTRRESLQDELDMKFFYYYMFIVDEWCRNNTNTSGFASVNMLKFKKLQIPIPSLEEQSRIVAILDKFEALVNDMSTGLPAEIRMRRQQYEYYRTKLLTFDRYE
jgi:type I restriction enzyme S subunit